MLFLLAVTTYAVPAPTSDLYPLELGARWVWSRTLATGETEVVTQAVDRVQKIQIDGKTVEAFVVTFGNGRTFAVRDEVAIRFYGMPLDIGPLTAVKVNPDGLVLLGIAPRTKATILAVPGGAPRTYRHQEVDALVGGARTKAIAFVTEPSAGGVVRTLVLIPGIGPSTPDFALGVVDDSGITVAPAQPEDPRAGVRFNQPITGWTLEKFVGGKPR